MNKLSRLAAERFDGDKKEALRFIIGNYNKETIQAYYDDMTEREKNLFTAEMLRQSLRHTPGGVSKAMDASVVMGAFNMSEDDIKHAEDNPFHGLITKYLIWVLGLLTVIAGLLLLGSLCADRTIFQRGSMMWRTLFEASALMLGFVDLVWLFRLFSTVVYYFKFNRLKKLYNSEAYQKEKEELEQWKHRQKIGDILEDGAADEK